MITQEDRESEKLTYLINTAAPDNYQPGKHVFYSDDKNGLVALGSRLLLELSMRAASVPLLDERQEADAGFGYRLYVFGHDHQEDHCRQYAGSGITYRGWRGHEDPTIDFELGPPLILE